MTARPSVLHLSRLSQRGDEKLSQAFDLVFLRDQADTEAFLQREGARFELAVTTAPVGLSPETLALLPNLKALACRGIGTDKICWPQVKARGIQVSTTPDVLTECVADLAMGLLIDVMRGMSDADRYLRSGLWPQGTYPLTRRVWGKRLGVVGMGRIGQAIAHRALAFRMDIRYFNRRPRIDLPYSASPSLEELARWSDVLMVAVTGGAHTHHLISESVLEALGPEGYLVNISRGSVIDEGALVRLLAERKIGGAGLDVFEHEPSVPQTLLEMPHVVLLPHVGSGTEETRRAMEDLVLDNAKSFFETGRFITPAQPD
ncbi:MAG: 2-hydroxyacid dehydrogenase [Betaproteobacteria bacterium]|nr:2-hydroxyacid dehydrogenase [Betaproteobacteria bacterium]NCA16218.1 2-hydroxyacid dehydrogenase [Betaproteobacteria bacterium]